MVLRLTRSLFAVLSAAFLFSLGVRAQSLQVTYGSKGVQTLVYNGVTLENTNAYSADVFHIWHMKATDLSRNVLSTGQYGWGESNSGTSWNAQTNTETYNFVWGSISTQFAQSGNNLNVIVTGKRIAPGQGFILTGRRFTRWLCIFRWTQVVSMAIRNMPLLPPIRGSAWPTSVAV